MNAAPSPALTKQLDEARRLLASGQLDKARTVEPLLEQPWMELMKSTTTKSPDVLPGSDEELMLESTTLLAESYFALGRFSSALDVVEEARNRIALREFDELFARLEAGFDPNDESVPAELHAVRRQVTKRYLFATEQDEFSSTEGIETQPTGNRKSSDAPKGGGFMGKKKKKR